jgi:uroporphyrinogen III methyltransferase/synthase
LIRQVALRRCFAYLPPHMKSKGTVYLVGAGPGDAGLLTMRGAELLARADVVVYDALVNPELLRLAPKTAEVIFGGKRASQHAIPQEELNKMLVTKAREGKCVVRLKGGDPYVFGRGGEEAEELVAAKIPFEVVPGISSAIAAPNYAGIPITHREHCSSFTVFTGHEDPTKDETTLDWAQVAKTPGTKVILMGVLRLRNNSAALIEHGMSPATPVAMVRWGTTGQQQSIEGTLATIADIVEKEKFTAPAVTVIGDVVKLRKKLNWFERRPLFGQRIVVTRTREQASQLSKQLLERGAEVLEIPTIKITEPNERQNVLDVLLELNSYDWLVFTSPNGVDAFFNYFFKAFEDMRDIGGVRIAAVGPATAAKLKELHLKVDLMPAEYVADQIADAFAKYESIENLKILLARAEVATPELPKKLEEMGAIIDDVAFYKTVPETEDVNGAAAKLAADGADWITFTSSSTVENFHARFNLTELVKKFPKIKLASIGPETTKAIVKLGLTPTLEAKPHTIDGLVTALEEAVEK